MRPPAPARLLLPSLGGWLWLAVFLGGAFGPAAAAFVSGDGDLALHVLLGDLVRERGALLEAEPTTFTAGELPFVAHEWLAQVLFSLLHAGLGLRGPLLLVAALLATTLALVLRRARRAGASAWPALGATLGAALVAHNHLIARPHVLSWLFASLWCFRLEDLRAGRLPLRRALALAAPLACLWANLHGGFVLAFLLLLLQGAGELLEAAGSGPADRRAAARRLRSLAAVGAVALAASLVNPFGPKLHAHVLSFVGAGPLVDHVAEFASPDFHDPHERLYLAYALGVLALLGVGARRASAPEWLQTLGLFALSLQAVRGEPLFAFLTAPLAARRLEEWCRDLAGGPSLAGRCAAAVAASSARLERSEGATGGSATLAAALGLAVVAGAAGWVAPLPFDPTRQPVGAVAFLRAHPQLLRGPMFNHYAWGGYLAYELYPARRVFVHGFNDHYGPALFAEYRTVEMLGAGWQEILERRGVAWVLVRSDVPLARELRARGWRLVYADELATILVRAPAGGKGASAARGGCRGRPDPASPPDPCGPPMPRVPLRLAARLGR
jgi:hypothetical protein